MSIKLASQLYLLEPFVLVWVLQGYFWIMSEREFWIDCYIHCHHIEMPEDFFLTYILCATISSDDMYSFRLEIGSLFSKSSEFAKAPDFTKTGEPTSGDSFFTNYNQQAAESIKNSIGVSCAFAF